MPPWHKTLGLGRAEDASGPGPRLHVAVEEEQEAVAGGQVEVVGETGPTRGSHVLHMLI